VLDPKANPALFQSTLVIIIKVRRVLATFEDTVRFTILFYQDVVDSDKVEIARE
jgi:hypothetical protein